MKRGILFVLIFVVLSIILLSSITSSLGISPAIREYNFIPGEKIEIIYKVSTDDPNRKIEIFTNDGGFGAIVKTDKEVLIGSGNFKLTIIFPNEVSNPGIHSISVGVKEAPPENVFIGTAVSIAGAVRVYVPYPGRYAEASLNIPDGNIDEQIPVELKVINRGKETLNVKPSINFISESGEKIFTMDFSPVLLDTGDNQYFRKFLDSSGYRPGNYIAEAVIDYGEQTRINKTIRIGHLYVNLVNFTESLPKEGIQKFLINIESKWNGNIDNVYADVNISNEVESIFFRTPSVELNSWGTNTLTGFLDTSELEGQYITNIILNYAGEQTFANGLLTIIEFNYLLWIGIGAGLLIFILIIIIIVLLKRRKISKKKRR